MLPKLMIVGHCRHGKDTVSDILEKKYGYKFKSTTEICLDLFMFEKLKEKYHYTTKEECYQDRHAHRPEWSATIHEYCKDDLARIGRSVFKDYDIYCGLRNKHEFFAMKNEELFDYAIWVDRSEHLPPEDPRSMSIEQWMCDYTIDNNADLDRLYKNIDILMNTLIKKHKQNLS